MSVLKHAARGLGLVFALVGLMATACVAQAEPNAFWLVNGAKFTTLKPTVEASTDVEKTFLTELGGKFIHLKCSTILFQGHLSEPLGQILGSFLFHGCKFFELVTPGGTLKELSACQPRVGVNLGLVQTNSITGLIKLHEGKAQIEAKPTSGTTFLNFVLGEECAFGENIQVGGVIWLNDTASETNAVTHLVPDGKLTKLTINGGFKTAAIDGSAFVKLGGAHTGLTFSARPG